MTTFEDSIAVFGDVPLLAEAGPDITAELESEMDLLPHLDGDQRQEVDGAARECRDARQIKHAADAIGPIPGPSQAWHLVVGGRWALWDAVPAILDLAAPATITTLHIATLGFSKLNVMELCRLLDEGKVGEVRLLCSHYFRGTSGGIWELAAAELAERQDRAKFLSVRTHAKLLAIKLSDGRTVTVESSANLRSCKNVEQMTVIGDPGVYAFHVAWIDQLFARAAARAQQDGAPPRKHRPGHSQKRAGLGVYAVAIDPDARHEVTAWKAAANPDPATTQRFAADLVDLIRQFSPTLPSDAIVTMPPQGASAPGRYHARLLAEAVAEQIGRPCQETLIRNRPKRGHHPQESRRQEPYTIKAQTPRFAIVLDDMVTSGTTMRLSLEALRGAGAVALGFAYAGC